MVDTEIPVWLMGSERPLLCEQFCDLAGGPRKRVMTSCSTSFCPLRFPRGRPMPRNPGSDLLFPGSVPVTSLRSPESPLGRAGLFRIVVLVPLQVFFPGATTCPLKIKALVVHGFVCSATSPGWFIPRPTSFILVSGGTFRVNVSGFSRGILELGVRLSTHLYGILLLSASACRDFGSEVSGEWSTRCDSCSKQKGLGVKELNILPTIINLLKRLHFTECVPSISYVQ